jgi:hypothetical protein
MICEKCGNEGDTTRCGGCGEVILRLGPYCYLCGSMAAKPEIAVEETEGDDFADRVLCSDGTCIGVINEKGVCKVCGKPYSPESA